MKSLFDILTDSHSSGHTSRQEEAKKSNDVDINNDNRPPNVAHKRKSRKVSFFPSVIVYDYIGRDELLEDEKRNAWYNREDLHEIHLDNIETVHRMTSGEWTTTEQSVFCARGLEGRTNAGTRRRWQHRFDAIQVVRQHQAMEMEPGKKSHHPTISLAEAYAQRTRQSAHIARLLANIDAQAVQQQQEAETTMPIPSSPSKLPTRGSTDHLFQHISSLEHASPSVLRAH